MKFPNMVYRCPGPHQRPGGTFAFQGVANEGELAKAVKEGWFETLPEAINGRASLVEAWKVPADSPPTRAELEQKAKELGIQFDKKTTDEALSKKISDAVGI